MLLYGVEAWTLLSTNVAVLRVFERKVLRKNFGPVCVGDIAVSCMSNSTTWTFYSVLISSGCSGTALSFVWRRMLRRDRYLIQGSTEVGEEDELVSVGRT